MVWRRTLRALAHGTVAVLVTTVVGTLVQTQFNLGALVELGLPIGWDVRLQTSLRDLLGFGPAFAAIVFAGFAIALPVATLLQRRWPKQHLLLPLAGAIAILAALGLMRLLLKLTAIAAARDPWAIILLALAGALGGWVYARLRGAGR